jgi:hypothetical protein
LKKIEKMEVDLNMLWYMVSSPNVLTIIAKYVQKLTWWPTSLYTLHQYGYNLPSAHSNFACYMCIAHVIWLAHMYIEQTNFNVMYTLWGVTWICMKYNLNNPLMTWFDPYANDKPSINDSKGTYL